MVTVLRRLQIDHGIGTTAAQGRDIMMYRVDALRGSAHHATQLLADTITQPLFSDEELEEARVRLLPLLLSPPPYAST